MGKKSPKPPDPFATAAAQSAANKDAVRESARVSAVDQFAPWGSTTFQRRPDGTPSSQTISFSPEQQQFYDTSTRIGNQLAGKAEGMVGQIPTTPFRLSDVPSGAPVSDALYERRKAMIEPDLARSRNLMNTELSERGIPIGSEIFNNERNRFDRMQNEAYSNIANEAILAGTAEEDRQLQRALLERGQSFNEASAFLQGSPALPTPSFQSTGQYNVAPPDIAGLVSNDYNARVNQANQRNSAISSAFGGLGSLSLKGG